MNSNPRKYVSRKAPHLSEASVRVSSEPPKKTEIQLPYKLLRFPSPRRNLWNHVSVGNGNIVHLFNSRTVKLHLEKPVLKLGYDHTVSNVKQENPFACKLLGKIIVSENEKNLTFTFNSIICSEKDEDSHNVTTPCSLNDCEASADFSTNFRAQSGNCMQPFVTENAIKKILNCISKKGALAFRHYTICNLQCHFVQKSNEILCSLVFTTTTLSETLELYPIVPIPIIPTALSKGLGDPVGNKFLHGEPKSGFLTMDEIHRLLLVLESDPKVASLPIVGIWVSGIRSWNHPYVWAACIRYLHSSTVQERICSPPDPFLLVIYEKPSYVAKFYNCFVQDFMSPLSSVLYSGSMKSVFSSTGDIKQDDLCLNLERVVAVHPKTVKDLVINSFKRVSVYEKSNFTPKSPNCTKDSLTSNFTGQSETIKCMITHDDASAVIAEELCSDDLNHTHDNEKTDNDHWNGVNRTKNSSWHSSSASAQSATSYRSLLENSQPKRDLYGLILAQDQQLKQLKEQLGWLLRERQQANLSPPVILSPAANKNEVQTTKETTASSRQTASAGTMTSFAWPLRPHNIIGQIPSAMHSEANETDTALSEDRFPSPEIERKQPLASSFRSPINAIDDSLLNVQLATFVESVGSAQPSILIDLPEYPESVSSYSQTSDRNFSDVYQQQDGCGQTPIQDEVINMTSNYADCSEDSIFYDNLLKRIQAILLKQDLQHEEPVECVNDNEKRSICALPLKERSAFDSLLIPHLNYVSLLSTDSECDQSLEFRSLALKYLHKQPGKFLGNLQQSTLDSDTMNSLLTLWHTSKSNFSFTSNRYLQKHGLIKPE